MNTIKLNEALQAIAACESPWSRDNSPPWGIHDADPAPFNRLYGPVYPRGAVSAIVFQRGECLAQIGDVHRADLTFSVAKTYLALLAGVAHDQGLLTDVREPVYRRCPGIGFDEGRLQRITWEHLLQQENPTSLRFIRMMPSPPDSIRMEESYDTCYRVARLR